LDLPFSSFRSLQPFDGGVVCVAGSPTTAPAVVHIDIDTGGVEILHRSRVIDVERGYLSVPRHIEFPTESGLTAHAQYYPPANRDFEGPQSSRPPLLVMSHGGPTSSASSELNLAVQ